MPQLPMYQQFPSRYSFNKVTSRHMLKSGRAYKTAFTANPDNFVESVVMLETEARLPSITALPEPVTALPIAPPVVIESVREPTEDKSSIVKQRELIQQLIKEELQANSKPYENKKS